MAKDATCIRQAINANVTLHARLNISLLNWQLNNKITSFSLFRFNSYLPSVRFDNIISQ